MRIHFVISGDIYKLTGGSIYNERIMSGLKDCGYDVVIHHLNDDFPFPLEKSLEQCRHELNTMPPGDIVIIDSLVFGVIPDFLETLSKTNTIIPIIHLLVSENKEYSECEQSLLRKSEYEALKYASKIIATSEFTKKTLLNAGIREHKIEVIIPGVDNYPRKTGYNRQPQELVCISNYTPGKGHLVLVHALSKLKDMPWELHCYGDLHFNPNYVNHLKTLIRSYNLEDRIHINPSLARNQITNVLLGADLFVHPSSFETYGMAITEALVHGVPVVVSSGGGICSTVPAGMGIFYEPDNIDSLSRILQKIFDDPLAYRELCGNASEYYKQSTSWDRNIQLFQEILDTV